MLNPKKLLAVGALVAGLLLPAQAMAAVEAHPTVDLNVRIGPSVSYGVIAVVPAWHPVTVFGCIEDILWCDIDFEGIRGWVAARYLVQPGTAVYMPRWAPRVGLPIISFSFHVYHDRHYRGRPWHRQRTGRWHGRQEVHGPRHRTEQRQRRPKATEQYQRRPQVTQKRQRRPKATEQYQRRPQVTQKRRALQQHQGSRAERKGRGRDEDRKKRRRNSSVY